jgi:hypothetical protein
MRGLFRRGRGARIKHGSSCFCDACATVTNCDTSHRIADARQDALSRSVGLRPF